MADENNEEEQDAKKGPGIVVLLATVLVAGGAGAAIPFFLNSPAPAEEEVEDEISDFEKPAPEDTMVLEFGDVTVNLNDGKMNRYLRLKISVLVAKDDELMVTEAITNKGPVLKNWMLSHLSDKSIEEIRGAAGLNMLRRELLSQFNDVLFTDHLDHVYDVLFEEFNIQ